MRRAHIAPPIALAAGLLLVGASCGGSTKVPTSFGNLSETQTIYQMVLATDDGSVIELNDGSVWAVAAADQVTVLHHWSLDSNRVDIGKDGHTLINSESGGRDNIRATRVGTTASDRVYTHIGANTLSGIGHGEYFNGTADGSILSLADGSVWLIPDANDQETVIDWADGDDVVVKRNASSNTPHPAYTIDDTDVASSVTGVFVGG